MTYCVAMRLCDGLVFASTPGPMRGSITLRRSKNFTFFSVKANGCW